MGPQHPSTHGVLRVVLKLDGEKITGTDCVIGYLHRGVEKIANLIDRNVSALERFGQDQPASRAALSPGMAESNQPPARVMPVVRIRGVQVWTVNRRSGHR